MLNLKFIVLCLQIMCLFLYIHMYNVLTIHAEINDIHTASVQHLQLYYQWKWSKSEEWIKTSYLQLWIKKWIKQKVILHSNFVYI